MNKSSNMFCCLLIAILLLDLSNQSKADDVTSIILKLDRHTLDLRNIKQDTPENSLCLAPSKIKDRKQGFTDNIQIPANCQNQQEKQIKIVQNCLLNNLAYNVKVYLGSGKLNSKSMFYQLTLDLTSPWTWVKSSICQTCDRDGSICKQGCEYNNYKSTLTCSKDNKCQAIQKCGEIDLFQEGLSVIGQFSNIPMRFKDMGYSDPGIKQIKILQSHYLSGQDLLQSDGMLGLGQEFQDSDDLRILISKTIKNSSKQDDTDQDDDDDTDDDSDKQSSPKQILTGEQNTGILSKIVEKYTNVNFQVFSIYISDSEFHSDKVLMLGQYSTDYVHEPQHNPISYVNLYTGSIQAKNDDDDNDDSDDDDDDQPTDYYLWKVLVSHIDIQTEDRPETKTQIDASSIAIISLRTTALVLPKAQISQIRQVLEDKFKIKCLIVSNLQYFINCKDLDSKDALSNIYFTVFIGDGNVNIPIIVNPQSLILDCQNGKNKKVDCILNIQQSYDGVIVLGESVLQNSYMVFDMENKQLGIAPAKNKYNENLYYLMKQGVYDVARDVEVDIEFMNVYRFTAVIVLLTIALCCFRNIDCVSRIIERIIGPRKVRINPTYADNRGSHQSALNESHQNNGESQQELDESVVSSQNIDDTNFDLESDEKMKQKIFEMNEQDTLEEL